MKEIIKTIVIVILVIVAIYFSFLVGKLNNRMDYLNRQDSLITSQYDDFSFRLKDLELQFIGRGKHIQQFQRDLKDLELMLYEKEAKLISRIDSVGLLLSDFKIETNNQLQNLKNSIDAVDERLASFQRQMTRSTTDLQTATIRLKRNLKDLDERLKTVEKKVFPKKK